MREITHLQGGIDMRSSYPEIGDEVQAIDISTPDQDMVWGVLVEKRKDGKYVDYYVAFTNSKGGKARYRCMPKEVRSKKIWRKAAIDTEDRLTDLLERLYG